MTLASIAIGGSITAIGIYAPFMWFGAAVFTVGSGLLYTLQVDSPAGKWIGYQILAGFGAGAGIQIPFIAVQVVLNSKDMPTGSRYCPIYDLFDADTFLDAMAIFFNTLGGAISISVAQNIFSNTLSRELLRRTRDIDPLTIIRAGATRVREVTPPDQLRAVLESYNEAIQRCFVLPIAVGGLALICSFFVSIPLLTPHGEAVDES